MPVTLFPQSDDAQLSSTRLPAGHSSWYYPSRQLTSIRCSKDLRTSIFTQDP